MHVLLHVFVIIYPTKNGHGFVVVVELTIMDTRFMAVREKTLAIKFQLQMDFEGASLDGHKEVRERCSDSQDFFDTKLFMGVDDHRQKFLLHERLAMKNRDGLYIKLVGERIFLDTCELI